MQRGGPSTAAPAAPARAAAGGTQRPCCWNDPAGRSPAVARLCRVARQHRTQQGAGACCWRILRPRAVRPGRPAPLQGRWTAQRQTAARQGCVLSQRQTAPRSLVEPHCQGARLARCRARAVRTAARPRATKRCSTSPCPWHPPWADAASPRAAPLQRLGIDESRAYSPTPLASV